MPQDYFPTGPFLREWPDRGEFDIAREDFLLGFIEPTARAYKSDLEDFAEWCEKQGVDPMTPPAADAAGYLESLAGRGYAKATIDRHASLVRGFLRHIGSRER